MDRLWRCAIPPLPKGRGLSRDQMTDCPTEAQEQRRLAEWLYVRKLVWVHVPNEGKRSPRTGRMLKLTGMQAGFPDVVLFSAPPNKPSARGAAIELKRVKGSKTSVEQMEWLLALGECGWETYLARGADAAIAWLTELGY